MTARRVALVTGASGAIGAATVLALAADGFAVVAGYGRDRAAAETLVAKIEADGATGRAIAIDVRDAAAVDTAFTTVEQELGAVDVVVNNAGIARDGLLVRMRDEQWADVLATNLTGAFHVTRRATPPMLRARRGRFVHVGSVAGTVGSAGQANYAAAKAGLIGLSRSLARELASRGVTSNVVEPGPVTSAMTDRLSEERRAALAAQVPLGRFGRAAEVAAVIAFLCSDAASYVTGAVIPVDGGLAMGR